MMTPLLGALLPVVGDVIRRFIPDKQAAAEAERELERAAIAGELQSVETRMSAILMEAKSEDPWTSRARPSFLYVMYFYLVSAVPYAVLALPFPEQAEAIPALMRQWFDAIPGEMWALFGTGYLGYAVLRGKDKKMIANLMKRSG